MFCVIPPEPLRSTALVLQVAPHLLSVVHPQVALQIVDLASRILRRLKGAGVRLHCLSDLRARQLRRWCACSILLSLSTGAKAPAATLGLNAVVVVYPLDSCSSRLPAPPVLGGTLNNAIDNR